MSLPQLVVCSFKLSYLKIMKMIVMEIMIIDVTREIATMLEMIVMIVIFMIAIVVFPSYAKSYNLPSFQSRIDKLDLTSLSS